MASAPEQQKTTTGPWGPYKPFYKELGRDLMNEYRNDSPAVWGVAREKSPKGQYDPYGPKPVIVNPDTGGQPDRDTLGNPRNSEGPRGLFRR